MVKLNTQEAVYAGKQDVSLTLEKFPGFKLEIPKNSVTFPDGAREGYISVTAVNASTVPMAPPNGMQPQFIVTIQPTGTRFNPPARLSLPNVDAHAPGAQVEMYSYDHDLEEFVAIGLGTVSEDGTTVRSNPGVGVIKAGWHCGSQPGGSGTASHCDVCFKCDGTTCVKDPGQAKNATPQQVPGNCRTETCDGAGVVNEGDKPEFDVIFGDCRKPGCERDGVDLAKEIEDKDIRPEDAECKECVSGGLKNKEDTAMPLVPPAAKGPDPEPKDYLSAWGRNINYGYNFELSCMKICEKGIKKYVLGGDIKRSENWKVEISTTVKAPDCATQNRAVVDMERTRVHELKHRDLLLAIINNAKSGIPAVYGNYDACNQELIERRSNLQKNWSHELIKQDSHVDFKFETKYFYACRDGVAEELPCGLFGDCPGGNTY